MLGPVSVRVDQYGAVALERQPERHEPRAGQRAAGRDALQRGDHTGEFVARACCRFGRRLTVRLTALSSPGAGRARWSVIAPAAARRLSSARHRPLLASRPAPRRAPRSSRATNTQHGIRHEVIGPMLGSPPRESSSATDLAVPARRPGAGRSPPAAAAVAAARRRARTPMSTRCSPTRSSGKDKKVESGKLDLSLTIDAKNTEGVSGPRHAQRQRPVPDRGQAEAAQVQDRLRLRGRRPEHQGGADLDGRPRASSTSRAPTTPSPTRSSSSSRPATSRPRRRATRRTSRSPRSASIRASGSPTPRTRVRPRSATTT